MQYFPRFAFLHTTLELAVVPVIGGVADAQVVNARFGLEVQGIVVLQLEAANGHIIMAMPVGADPVVSVFSVSFE